MNVASLSGADATLAMVRMTTARARIRSSARRRVLFVGEASTLAHAARPIALAAALPPDRYDVTLACPETYFHWVPDHVATVQLATQPPRQFLARVANGRPPFDRATLERYVTDDLELLARLRPDVVIGDARLSLAASARLATTPYIALSNAYWHPHRVFHPELPVLRWMRGLPLAPSLALFPITAPLALRWTAAPIHQVLAAHGVDIRGDIRRAWTEADLTLYADIPQLFPEVSPDDRYQFLGPIAWEPPTSLPSWWNLIPGDRPVVYLTMGSSGHVRALSVILEALRALDWVALVATAGRADVVGEDRRVFVADFLPGAAASARADMVICNGGSPTTTQALLAGRPVLGVCANEDQFLNMQVVAASGAGAKLRADRLTPAMIAQALTRLRAPEHARAAQSLAASGAALDSIAIVTQAIDELAARRPGQTLKSTS